MSEKHGRAASWLAAGLLITLRPALRENRQEYLPARSGLGLPVAPPIVPLSAGDYCRLAEECFRLAAIAKDPEAAAETSSL
jgi:hypothetical protein